MKLQHTGAFLALFLLACSPTIKSPTPVGGSRADGTIELAYDLGGMENAQVDWTAAQIQAEQRCMSWGYTAAEKFGGERRQCTAPSGYGCLAWQVTVPYQCTGGKPVAQNQ